MVMNHHIALYKTIWIKHDFTTLYLNSWHDAMDHQNQLLNKKTKKNKRKTGAYSNISSNH